MLLLLTDGIEVKIDSPSFLIVTLVHLLLETTQTSKLDRQTDRQTDGLTLISSSIRVRLNSDALSCTISSWVSSLGYSGLWKGVGVI